MTKYAGPTGNEPGRPRPESIDQALARITAEQQGLPVEKRRDGRFRTSSARGGAVLRRSGRAVTDRAWFWPVVRWLVVLAVFLLLVRCAGSVDLTGGV